MRVHYTCVKEGGALSACACACINLRARGANTKMPQRKNEWNKWKNHFYEMKGDVGMSLHEKERNKKMPTPRHKVTHNPIPTSLFLPRLQRTFSCRQLRCQDVVLFALPNAYIANKQTNKQTNNMLKQDKDVGNGL